MNGLSKRIALTTYRLQGGLFRLEPSHVCKNINKIKGHIRPKKDKSGYIWSKLRRIFVHIWQSLSTTQRVLIAIAAMLISPFVMCWYGLEAYYKQLRKYIKRSSKPKDGDENE